MSIYIRNKATGLYWIRFQIQGRRVHQSSGFTDRLRAQEYHDQLRLKILDETRLGRKPQNTWNDAAGEWLLEMEDKRSIDKDQEIIRWLHPVLDGVLLTSIDRSTIESIRRRKAKETSKSTANRYMALVRAILRKAQRDWEWIEHVPRIPMFRVRERRVITITRKKANELIMALPPHLSVMASFTLETGLRRSNVTHLRWDQIDIDQSAAWVYADETKGQAIPVPLSEHAMDIIRSQVGIDETYVFTYRDRPVHQTSTKAWRKACANVGLAGLHWHDLRHIWASWLAQDGVPDMVIQELGGWQSQEMVRRYAHFKTKHLRKYVDRDTPKTHHSNVVDIRKRRK